MAAEVVEELCRDLLAERAQLDEMLESCGDETWAIETPAAAWEVVDQVTHLAYFDDVARCAIDDPDQFERERCRAGGDIDGYVERVRATHHDIGGEQARAWLRDAGSGLVASARRADSDRRVPWFGPPMSLASALSARLMETWAHGQDVADALGFEREPTSRLRHVVHLGVRAFANSFLANDLAVPAESVRVELVAPTGETWRLGPEGADASIRGSAVDFCLVVTQRRHRDDTDLLAFGAVADRWLDIAQAFAGPPGMGRSPEARS